MRDAIGRAVSGAGTMDTNFVELFTGYDGKSRRIVGHIWFQLNRDGSKMVILEYRLPKTMSEDELFEDLPVAITHEWLHYALFKLGITEINSNVESIVESLAQWSVRGRRNT